MIAIVDYGVGNLASIANMLKKVGGGGEVTRDADVIGSAHGIILPGVGHFDHCARRLRDSGLLSVIMPRVRKERVPLLGICVGMQLLARGSEEGVEPGLDWVPGMVRRLQPEAGTKLPVPHMGWARVHPRESSPLFDAKEPERFYFVHSFHFVCDDEADVAAWAEYGTRFVASVRHDNVFGTQFHPEKSHRFGMALMRRFAALARERA